MPKLLFSNCAMAWQNNYPAVLEAFEDWTSVSAWMFLQRFPTPELLAQAGKRQWQKFLHIRRLWGSDQGPRRMEIFAHATELSGSVPTANAKSLLALSLARPRLRPARCMGSKTKGEQHRLGEAASLTAGPKFVKS